MIVLVTVGLRGDRVDGALLRGRGDGVADDVERRGSRTPRPREIFFIY